MARWGRQERVLEAPGGAGAGGSRAAGPRSHLYGLPTHPRSQQGRGQRGGESRGMPHPFLGAHRGLSQGQGDVLGTHKVLAVLNPLAQLLGTAGAVAAPRAAALMPFWGAGASTSHGDAQRGTRWTLGTRRSGELELAAAQGGPGGYLGCPGMLRRSWMKSGSSPGGEMAPAGAGGRLRSVPWLFNHKAVTCRRGDSDQLPPAAPPNPQGTRPAPWALRVL